MQVTMYRFAALVIAIATLSAVVTGCARQPSPQLTRPDTTSATSSAPDATATPIPQPANASPVVVCLVKSEKIWPVRRSVGPPSVASGAMKMLLAGPTADEIADGAGTLIPKGTRLLGVSIKQGTATVDLSNEFGSGGGSLSMMGRVAQVVFTLTQFDGVDRVAFRMNGSPIEALGGEGLILEEPQTRADWEDFAPAILVEYPAAGDIITTPLRTTGTANVFEAVFQLEVLDSAGKVLAKQRVQATSGTGTRGTFDSTLRWNGSPVGSGTVVAYYASPKDGSRVVVARVPVTFK